LPLPIPIPSTDDQRAAQLDAAIDAERANLEALEARDEQNRLQTAKCRARLGKLIDERRALTPHDQKTKLMDVIAEAHGRKRSWAFDNVNYHKLANVHGYDFCSLQKMSVEQVRKECSRLEGTDHADQGEVEDEKVENTIDLVLNDLLHFNQAERRHRLTLLRRKRDRQIELRWWADSIDYAELILPTSERRRGLSRVMIDSGAYTASTSGITIDLAGYCDFLEQNPDWISVALDEINPDDPEESARISFDRYERMRARGLDPMPVYHAGEHIDWLKRYLDLGVEIVGLGGVAGMTGSNREAQAFFDQSVETIKQAGRPIRIHCFGCAIPEILLRWPFDSADASTWINHAQKNRLTDLSRLSAMATLFVGGRADRWRHIP
jgi:hypothetical protein